MIQVPTFSLISQTFRRYAIHSCMNCPSGTQGPSSGVVVRCVGAGRWARSFLQLRARRVLQLLPVGREAARRSTLRPFWPRAQAGCGGQVLDQRHARVVLTTVMGRRHERRPTSACNLANVSPGANPASARPLFTPAAPLGARNLCGGVPIHFFFHGRLPRHPVAALR